METTASMVNSPTLEGIHRKLGGWLCGGLREVAGCLWKLWTWAADLEESSLQERQRLTGCLVHCGSLWHGALMGHWPPSKVIRLPGPKNASQGRGALPGSVKQEPPEQPLNREDRFLREKQEPGAGSALRSG